MPKKDIKRTWLVVIISLVIIFVIVIGFSYLIKNKYSNDGSKRTESLSNEDIYKSIGGPTELDKEYFKQFEPEEGVEPYEYPDDYFEQFEPEEGVEPYEYPDDYFEQFQVVE